MRDRRRDPAGRRDRPTSRPSPASPRPCTAVGRTARGVHAAGPIALGHRRLKIIDLSERGGQPMVDAELGLAAVFNGCIYNYQRAARRAGGRRLPLLLHVRHRGAAQGVPPLGRGVRGAVLRHVRVRRRRARHRRAHARPRPPGHQAALPRRDPERRPVRQLAARAAGGRRRRHLDRPGRAAPLHDVPLRRPRTAHDPRRACASCRPPRSARSGPTARGEEHVYWRPEHVRRDAGPGHERARLARRGAGVAAGRGAPPDGRRRARRGAALGRPRLVAGRGAARRRGPGRAQDVQRRLPRHGGRERRRVRVLRPRSPSTSAPTTSRSSSTPTGCCPPSTPPSPR